LTKESSQVRAKKQQKHINKLVCNFISKRFLLVPTDENGNITSQNNYADLIGLSSSVLTKMKEEEGYKVPLATIYNICQKENISLTEFFREFEKEYSYHIRN